MNMINTRERQPKKEGKYKVQVMVGYGANANMRNDYAEWRSIGARPAKWQVPDGPVVEYWGER